MSFQMKQKGSLLLVLMVRSELLKPSPGRRFHHREMLPSCSGSINTSEEPKSRDSRRKQKAMLGVSGSGGRARRDAGGVSSRSPEPQLERPESCLFSEGENAQTLTDYSS